MKTSDLVGKLLDRWVARSIGQPPGPAYSSAYEAGGAAQPRADHDLAHAGQAWSLVRLRGHPYR